MIAFYRGRGVYYCLLSLSFPIHKHNSQSYNFTGHRSLGRRGRGCDSRDDHYTSLHMQITIISIMIMAVVTGDCPFNISLQSTITLSTLTHHDYDTRANGFEWTNGREKGANYRVQEETLSLVMLSHSVALHSIGKS